MLFSTSVSCRVEIWHVYMSRFGAYFRVQIGGYEAAFMGAFWVVFDHRFALKLFSKVDRVREDSRGLRVKDKAISRTLLCRQTWLRLMFGIIE